MIVDLEVSILRDMRPRSRAGLIRIDTDSLESGRTMLAPGAASDGTERMMAQLWPTGKFSEDWLAFRCAIHIDSMPLASPRPGYVYLGHSDAYTTVLFLPVARPEDPRFGGTHILTVRRA